MYKQTAKMITMKLFTTPQIFSLAYANIHLQHQHTVNIPHTMIYHGCRSLSSCFFVFAAVLETLSAWLSDISQRMSTTASLFNKAELSFPPAKISLTNSSLFSWRSVSRCLQINKNARFQLWWPATRQAWNIMLLKNIIICQSHYTHSSHDTAISTLSSPAIQ